MFVLKIVFNMGTLATASSEQHGGCEQVCWPQEPPTRPGVGGWECDLKAINLEWISSFSLFFFFSHVSHKPPHTRLTFNKIKAPPPVTRACDKGIDFNEVC